MIRWPTRLLTCLIGGGLGVLVLAATADAADGCDGAHALEPQSGRCAAITDRSAELAATPAAQAEAGARPPSLAVMRAARRGAAQAQGGMPVPGGIGVGIIYRGGALQALNGGEIYTHMLVHPDGLRPSTGGLDWLFTTSTDRVGQGVELVGIYQRWSGTSHLGVFDWSCAVDFPCAGGITQPSWIWTRELASFACNTTITDSGRSTLYRAVYYRNGSRRLDGEASPLWRNQVLLWNYCTDGWDLIYRHEYRVQQEDCSRTGACAWWGPILETFESTTGEAYPAIRELGFTGTRLLHDGQWSNLPPAEADFVTPRAPWALSLLEPNRSFVAGNYPIRKVGLAVRPGVAAPCVDPASRAQVRAAILGAAGFSTARIDGLSVRIGRRSAAALAPRLIDVNGDGRPDLLFRFVPADTGLARGDTALPVLARLRGGNDIGGLGAVRVGTCS